MQLDAKQELVRNNGSEPDSLGPAMAEGVPANNVTRDIFEDLTANDGAGKTVQAQILVLLRELQRDFDTAIVLITHDLGVVAGPCDQVMVLYHGRVMEQGDAQHIFKAASHPYTQGLLRAVPRLGRASLSHPHARADSAGGRIARTARLPARCGVGATTK